MSSSENTPQPPTAEGIGSKASPYSVADTLARLEAAIQARGMKIFALVDHSGEAERAGLTMQPAKLLMFGAPRGGTPLMVASPLLALDLPLKALVWQDASGAVWVSYNSPSYLAARHHIPADLEQNIAGIDALIAAAFHA